MHGGTSYQLNTKPDGYQKLSWATEKWNKNELDTQILYCRCLLWLFAMHTD